MTSVVPLHSFVRFVRGRIRKSTKHPEPFEFVVSKKTADTLVEPFGYSSALHDLILKGWDGSEQKRLEVIPMDIRRHPGMLSQPTVASCVSFMSKNVLALPYCAAMH